MNDKVNQCDEQAREYDCLNNRLFFFQIVFVAVLLAAYFFSGASASLADGLVRRFGESHWYLTNAVYIMVTLFGFVACMFPFTYYGSYVLEHHYERSDEGFGDWLFDFFKSFLLDLVLVTILFSVVYALLRWSVDWWWLYSTGFYILFTVVLSIISPVLIMPLFNTFKPVKEDELTAAIRDMMAAANIHVTGVFKWDSEEQPDTAYAAITGFGKTRRIILSDTLLFTYTHEEILAILAHEIGHHKNHDAFRLMATNSFSALIGFYISHLCLTGLSALFGFEQLYSIGAAPLFIFSLFIFSLVSMPFSNLHSRRREFAADMYAAETMGTIDPLVSAFEKQAAENRSNNDPHPWIEFLLHSHPSIHRRITRLRQPMVN